MRLDIYLHDQPVATVGRGLGMERDEIALRPRPGIGDLSLSWRGFEPTGEELDRWLDNLLPENGSRVPFVLRAANRAVDAGFPEGPLTSVALLWGNFDADYSGAVQFSRQDEGIGDRTEPTRFEPIDDYGIGARLREIQAVASGRSREMPRSHRGRFTSLSGMRGKIGLTDLSTGAGDFRWAVAARWALNTWIAKHEDRRTLPGEAGVEAICQRAFGNLGIPAARTLSRVFDGVQAVLSERCDRVFDGETGAVRRRHFEEFASATGWRGADKYQSGRRGEPLWDRAYALLPESERGKLTAALAASVGIGHSDLHRRNLAFLHEPGAEASLAPMYDVSSVAGMRAYDHTLALGIAGQRRFGKVGPKQWIDQAVRSGLDVEDTMGIVSDTLDALPDAVRDAGAAAKNEDENIQQTFVDKRVGETMKFAVKRQRQWREQLGAARRKRIRGLAESV